MMLKRVFIFILFISLFVSTSVFAQSKTDDIRHMLIISGSAKNGIMVMENLIDQFKQIIPDVPEEYWEIFMDKVSADDLIDLIIPIYDQHFTQSEIQDMIIFYESPTGRKLVDKLPEITQESMVAGEQWGATLGQMIYQNLLEDGYIDM